MEHVILLPFVSLFFFCQAQGPPKCREQAVSASGTLQLLPEKPPQRWARVEWKLMLEAEKWHRILTAEKNKDVSYSKGRFSGRAVFQQETLSLRISPVSMEDSGVYEADFEHTSGNITAMCFHVSVWEPIHLPHVETSILRWEQDWCNLSLVCTVPGAGKVSYAWSCTGDPLGALEHQPWLHRQVDGDADPTVCRCNASNPVSWNTSSTDIAAACRAVASGDSWSYCRVKGLLCLLVLGSLVTAVAVTHVLVRQRGPPSRGAASSSRAG